MPRTPKRAIGKGWYELVDKKGRTYYANVKTKESRWKWPAEVERAENGTDAAAPPKPPDSANRDRSVTSLISDVTISSDNSGSGAVEEFIEDISSRSMKHDAKQQAALVAKVEQIYSTKDFDKCDAIVASRTLDRKAFASKFYDIAEGGMFKKKDDVTSLLKWSAKPLKKALLQAVRDCKVKDAAVGAVQFMRNIQGYMLDRRTGKSELGHVKKLLSTVMKFGMERSSKGTGDWADMPMRTIMADELFCQLMKQTHAAPSASVEDIESSLERGWRLFHCVSGVVQPSPKVLPLALMHCDDALAEGGGRLVGTLSKRTKLQLLRAQKLRPRTQVPSVPEITASLDGGRMNQRVFTLPDDSGMIKPVVVPIDSWLSAGEAAKVVAAALGVSDDRPFALYDATPRGSDEEEDSRSNSSSDDSTSYEYTLIPTDAPLLDTVAGWEARIETDLKEKKGKDDIKTGARLEHIVFCVRYFIPPIPRNSRRDHVADQLIFLQALHEVRANRWKFKQAIRRSEFYHMAALQILAQARGSSPVANLQLTPDDLIAYLPRTLRDKDAAEGVAKIYDKLSVGCGPRGKKWYESREQYMDVVKKWDLFGMTQFVIESRGSTIQPQGRLLLAVCPHIINIIDCASMSLIHQLPYKALCRVDGPSRQGQVTLRFQPDVEGSTNAILKCTTVRGGQEKDLIAIIKIYKEYASGGAR